MCALFATSCLIVAASVWAATSGDSVLLASRRAGSIEAFSLETLKTTSRIRLPRRVEQVVSDPSLRSWICVLCKRPSRSSRLGEQHPFIIVGVTPLAETSPCRSSRAPAEWGSRYREGRRSECHRILGASTGGRLSPPGVRHEQHSRRQRCTHASIATPKAPAATPNHRT